MSTIYLMGTTDKCYVFIINANHVNLLQRLQCLVYGNIYWMCNMISDCNYFLHLVTYLFIFSTVAFGDNRFGLTK
ncbi:unnamed protein product [Schistosoma bovis]|nr:unnamed protein product [Schistosoma bovis]